MGKLTVELNDVLHREFKKACKAAGIRQTQAIRLMVRCFAEGIIRLEAKMVLTEDKKPY